MEIYRKGIWQKGFSSKDALVYSYDAFCDYWGDVEAPDKGTGAYKTKNRMWEAVMFYLEEYPEDRNNSIKPFNYNNDANDCSGVEFSIAMPLPFNHPETGNPIAYGGRFDLLGYVGDDLVIMDEKTSSSLGPTWNEQWKMRGQFIGYWWALQKLGLEPKAVIIRGISILKTKFGTQEVKMAIPQHVVDNWELAMMTKASNFLNNYKSYKMLANKIDASEKSKLHEYPICLPERAFTPAFGEACNAYGGCSFKDLCRSPNPSSWYSQYGIRDWNPLHKDHFDFSRDRLDKLQPIPENRNKSSFSLSDFE